MGNFVFNCVTFLLFLISDIILTYFKTWGKFMFFLFSSNFLLFISFWHQRGALENLGKFSHLELASKVLLFFVFFSPASTWRTWNPGEFNFESYETLWIIQTFQKMFSLLSKIALFSLSKKISYFSKFDPKKKGVSLLRRQLKNFLNF